MKKFIGILPAAGLGSRLHSLHYSKELLPIYFYKDSRGLMPSLVIENSLHAMKLAELKHCTVVISNQKHEIIKVLGDGSNVGLKLSYVIQQTQNGLAHAVGRGMEMSLLFDVPCCLALPDTIISPIDAILQIKNELITENADLVLGVFPTDFPERLGPVRFNKNGKVTNVYDKPERTDLANTWGIAAWNTKFSRLLQQQLQSSNGKDVTLGDVFDDACRAKLNVRALYFPSGSFHDLGTPDAISIFLSQLIKNEPPQR